MDKFNLIDHESAMDLIQDIQELPLNSENNLKCKASEAEKDENDEMDLTDVKSPQQRGLKPSRNSQEERKIQATKICNLID